MANDIHADNNYTGDDNLYVYEDDEVDREFEYNDEDDLDNSALNYAQSDSYASQEDGQESEMDEGAVEEHDPLHIPVFPIMLKVLSNPLEGWKELRRRKVTEEDAQSTCFYPLLAVMSICQFAQLLYSSRVGVTELIIEALCVFVGFFAGYFCIILLLRLLLPQEAKEDFNTDYGKSFVLVSLSTLCLFFSLTELLPMLWAVLIFMPLWTVYSMCRGVRFFNFPEHRSIYCTGLLCVLVVGVPVLIEWGLSEILPK